jgi:hypothetical protein
MKNLVQFVARSMLLFLLTGCYEKKTGPVEVKPVAKVDPDIFPPVKPAADSFSRQKAGRFIIVRKP